MIDLAYIASTGYSGSTLLTLLLNQHPQIATVGELKWGPINPDTYLCSCGTRLVDCEFWNAVRDDVFRCGRTFFWTNPGTDFRFPESPAADRIARARIRSSPFERFRSATLWTFRAVRRKWPIIRDMNRRIIAAVLARRRGDVFLDASKDPVRLKHLLSTGDYRIRILHLVRDGRGFMYSDMRHNRSSAEAAAREWLRTHHEIEHLRSWVGGDNVLQIRYEDLCTSVDEEMRRIHRFLGLPTLPRSNGDGKAVDHHILGNAMRLKPTWAVKLDESWRDGLDERNIRAFHQIAGNLSRQYGYA